MKTGWIRVALCCTMTAVALVLSLPALAQDAAPGAQTERVISQMTDRWGDDARLTLSDLSALPTRRGGADVKLPDMAAYRDALSKLQNLRTHTDIAILRLKGAPPAASIGPRSMREIARSLEKVETLLSQPIMDLYQADTPEVADTAVQAAISALTVGMQSVPEL